MAESPNNSGKTLKEQYVPLEQRESQKLSWMPFIWETAKFFIVTKLAAVVGTIVGEHVLKMPTLKLSKFIRHNQGTNIGAALGGGYELYQHWRKTTGQQLGVKSINSDLLTALDPAQLEREAKQQAEILEGIAKIQEDHAKRSTSHAQTELARRGNDAGKPLEC